MDELLQDFLTETTENLAGIDNDLVAFEQTPDDPTLIRNIFRLIHTIKGTCGFVGLTRLGHVAHAAENVLGLFRDGKLRASAEIINSVLASVDRMKAIVAGIGQTGTEPDGNDADLIARLAAIAGTDPVSPDPVVEAIAPDAEAGSAPVPEPSEKPAPPATASPRTPPAVHGDTSQGATLSAGANQTVRVSISLLEALMTGVSELVLARNQIVQGLRHLDVGPNQIPLQRLSQIVSELQEGVMKTRMQPIGVAWQKLPRLIRDLAQELGKKIDLQLLGAETDVDRQVLEIIKDPLTHMIRNSADHGIEAPADRIAAGKPETGRIVVRAYHEGGHVVIDVGDDGRGLDPDRIREKLIERSILTEAAAGQLSTAQIQQYIFDAGFSTASQVTAVSGRGVGMDVVRSNIEKIGGAIELQSTVGAGTRFIIRIPLTLAIASALIIEASGERFAIPQLAVRELVMVSPESDHLIETINGAPVLRLHDGLLPVLQLGSALGLSIGPSQEADYILVVQAGPHNFGIAVDRVLDTEEIVIKPVAPLLKSLAIYAGTTILGDGRVVMILDTNGLSMMIGNSGAEANRESPASSAAMEDHVAPTPLLVFEAGEQGPRCAVPLSQVDRIENLCLDQIEAAGARRVIQYRGLLMPLEVIDRNKPLPTHGTRPALVFADRLGPFGVIVGQIIDVLEADMTVHVGTSNPAYLGTAIVAGKATEIVNLAYFAASAWPADEARTSSFLARAA